MTTAAKADPTNYAERLSRATAQLGEFQDLIRFADTKAGAAITLEATLLTIFLSTYAPLLDRLLQRGSLWRLWPGLLALVLGVLFFVLSVGVFYLAFLTLLPRIRHTGPHQQTVAFFADVLQMEEDEFVARVSSMPLQELLQHTLREIYLLSEIVATKFRLQRRCFQWLRLALMSWVLAEVLILLTR